MRSLHRQASVVRSLHRQASVVVWAHTTTASPRSGPAASLDAQTPHVGPGQGQSSATCAQRTIPSECGLLPRARPAGRRAAAGASEPSTDRKAHAVAGELYGLAPYPSYDPRGGGRGPSLHVRVRTSHAVRSEPALHGRRTSRAPRSARCQKRARDRWRQRSGDRFEWSRPLVSQCATPPT